MHLQRPLRPKGSDASWMMTNELLNLPVSHEEVVDHLLVLSAVDAALGTAGLPLVSLQVMQQMQSVGIGRVFKVSITDAASFCFGS